MSLRNQLKKLFSGSFVQDVAKLSLGTLAGRLITIAALPLLTRLYSPDDFALLAAYLAIVSTIAVAACLRFEIAIPLADNEEDAKYLLILSLMTLAAVTLVVLVVIWVLPQQITDWSRQTTLQPFLWMIPIGIVALGLYSVTQYWATRARRFSQIAQTRISQAVIGVSASLSLGWTGIAPFGLLVGNILNTSAGSIKLVYWSIKNERNQFKSIEFLKLKKTLIKYKSYPICSTPESFFNTAGVQIPILLVAACAGAEAGFLMLSMQIMAAPMSLLGKSISQVYVSRAPQAIQKGKLGSFTSTIMLRLFKVGLLPSLTLGILAPWLVPFIFGAEWVRSGEVITLLVPWMLLQFVVSPVSMILHVTGNHINAMLLQFFGMAIRTGAVFFAAMFYSNYTTEAFAISSAFFYGIYLIAVFKITNALRNSSEQ